MSTGKLKPKPCTIFAAVSQRILLSVSSDLITDQRVNRTAMALKEAGYHVLVIGRAKKNSPEMPSRRYRIKRFRLPFEKGPLFYASLNLRLFWYLLWKHADILFANDLDTLPANYIVSKIKRIPLVYDSHEYFTGVPELQGRPRVYKIWKSIERRILPKLKYCITVNDSIAKLYEEEYGLKFITVRNVPVTDDVIYPDKGVLRGGLNLPLNRTIFILQGAGINIDRGAEEAVEAMQFTDGLLLIVGDGDVIPALKERVAELELENKVKFVPRQNPKVLRRFTRASDVGITLDKDTNINYRFSLPNKLFDYIHAGIPVLASNLPEVSKIVNDYQIGIVTETHHPEKLAQHFTSIAAKAKEGVYSEALKKASAEMNWMRERLKLVSLINQIP